MRYQPGDEAQRSTQGPLLRKLLEGKVRLCAFVFDRRSHNPSSVKTNHELKAALVPDKWNKSFGLGLLPSADDGRSDWAVS